MKDEKRFSASTSTVPAPPDGTPPERQIILPLTPPATDESQATSNPESPVSAVLGLIKEHQRHKSTGQSRQLKLTSLEYKNLLGRLEELPRLKSFVDDKLRWEYDPLEKVLYVQRMPTATHESFSEQVSQETKAQLDSIASGNDEAARFAARISSVRSGSIQLREFDSDDDIEIDQPYIQRQPDEQFQHEEAEYPGVVYEIACSQDGRELGKAAWTYIPYSNGNIKAVVGFELGYGKSKEARISMWQPRYLKEDEEGVEILEVETVIDRDHFRSSDGSATNTNKTLHLPLDCFATAEVATLQTEGLPGITITYKQLAEFLDKAERLQRIRQPALGEGSIGKKSRRQTRKRKRPSTPTEQLSSDREREFRVAENKSRHIRDSPLHQQPAAVAAYTDATPALPGESDETQELSTGKEIESVGKLYTIQATAGKGQGLVAATKILKGTRILSEVPIFRVPRDNSDIEALERIVAKEVECLNKDQQRTFFDLTNIYGNACSRPLGIARTNVLPLGSKARSGGLFPEASRINHSCRHNSQNTWNENIGRLTIHALRDIEEGEEITITYLAITSEYADRQRFLKEKFKFDCKCELCSLPRAQQKRSDARLREIQAIDSSIGSFFWGGLESERALRLLHKMFGLFEKGGIWDGSICRAYKDAYDIAIESGDKPRARIFAERTYDARRLIEGDDSPVTMRMKRVAEGLSADAQGLSVVDFENWLWMLPS